MENLLNSNHTLSFEECCIMFPAASAIRNLLANGIPPVDVLKNAVVHYESINSKLMIELAEYAKRYGSIPVE